VLQSQVGTLKSHRLAVMLSNKMRNHNFAKGVNEVVKLPVPFSLKEVAFE
jgi:hypothetical protein